MRLTAFITDIKGDPDFVVKEIVEFRDAEVEIPLNDSRVARLTVSMHDPVLGVDGSNVTPLNRMVKILYGPYLVFWGYIMQPVWDMAAETVTLNLHDPTLKLKHHYHRYGDYVVGTRFEGGYPMDAGGMQGLHESAWPNEDQLARGIPHPGIFWGLEWVEVQDPRPPDLEKSYDVGDGYGFWRIVERGGNVWESLQNVMQAVEGFDMEWRPVDEAHPPTYSPGGVGDEVPLPSGWLPGYYCQLNVFERQGADRSFGNEDDNAPVVFHMGGGRGNLEQFTWKPDGDAMRNYAVVTFPGGERNHLDSERKALAHIEDSWVEYGIYGLWESAGQKDTKKVLQAKADAFVAAYGYPPEFFEIVPMPDQSGETGLDQPYLYMRDFEVGDIISAAAKIGVFTQRVRGRIIKVTISQTENSKQARSRLDCVPSLVNDVSDIGAEEA